MLSRLFLFGVRRVLSPHPYDCWFMLSVVCNMQMHRPITTSLVLTPKGVWLNSDTQRRIHACGFAGSSLGLSTRLVHIAFPRSTSIPFLNAYHLSDSCRQSSRAPFPSRAQLGPVSAIPWLGWFWGESSTSDPTPPASSRSTPFHCHARPPSFSGPSPLQIVCLTLVVRTSSMCSCH